MPHSGLKHHHLAGCLSAESLGLPDIELRMAVVGWLWDDSVYDEVRQFHKAKGFDPCSQEAALAMGHALYQVACERDALFAYRLTVRETGVGDVDIEPRSCILHCDDLPSNEGLDQEYGACNV
ncbi:hypothetical protein B0H10DRAFT_1970767 [Mycena sp. CBHHK59/15]|nr:hypothetical protein B0H10DRAFT_1970767 [Mycena sp. CBHHK59/15]